MVATRVSPTATLPKTQAVIADVVRSLGDLERLPTSKRLQQDLEALQQYIASDALHIEVVIAAPVSDPDRAARIAQWLAPGLSSDVLATAPDAPLVLSPTQNGGPAVRLEVYSAVRPRSRRAAEPRAAVLVCIADPLSAVDDQARDSVEALCEDRPYALLIADGH